MYNPHAQFIVFEAIPVTAAGALPPITRMRPLPFGYPRRWRCDHEAESFALSPQRFGVTPMEIHQVVERFTARDILDRPATLPQGAVLLDFRMGPGHEGHPRENPNIASFRYDGILYYVSLAEVRVKTRVAWSSEGPAFVHSEWDIAK
jgi:hypothetical protein